MIQMQIFRLALLLVILSCSTCLETRDIQVTGLNRKSCRNNPSCKDSGLLNPCSRAVCFAQTNARCVNNCTSCEAVFHVDSHVINCNCGFQNVVRCTNNPCSRVICYAHPGARCRPSLCGWCHAVYYDENRNPVNCLEGTCRTPVSPTNGNVSSLGRFANIVLSGQSVLYRCNIGFGLIGEPRRTCQKNGIFTGFPPICKRSCQIPKPPKNGFVVSLQNRLPFLNDRIRYSCKPQFRLYGMAFASCKSNGKFSNNKPICRRECVIPKPLPRYVGISGATQVVYDGRQVKFICASGFRIATTNSTFQISNCTERGFQPKLPTCRKVYCQAPSILNGRTIPPSGRVTFSESVKYACNPGYNINKNIRMRCQDDTTFGDAVPPLCIKDLKCPAIDRGKICAINRCSMDRHCRSGKCCNSTCGRYCSTGAVCPNVTRDVNCVDPKNYVCVQGVTCKHGKCCPYACGGAICAKENVPKYCPINSNVNSHDTRTCNDTVVCDETSCPVDSGNLCCKIDGCTKCVKGLTSKQVVPLNSCPPFDPGDKCMRRRPKVECMEGVNCLGGKCCDGRCGRHCVRYKNVCPPDPNPSLRCQPGVRQCTNHLCAARGQLCCSINGCLKCVLGLSINSSAIID